MLKRNRMTKFAAILLVMFVMISMQPLTAQAAKPIGGGGGGKPVTNVAPMITGETTLTIDQDTSVTLSLKATDKNGDAISWSIPSQPINGLADVKSATTIKGTSTAVIDYIPKKGYSGTDSFTVEASDGKEGGTSKANIAVTINSTTQDPVIPQTISYVSLGDSIATGTLFSTTKIDSYVKYFYEYLITKNPSATVTLEKLATDGDQTKDLYTKLGLLKDNAENPIPGDTALITAVEGADFITLSIGGNNLMQAAKDESSLGGYNFNSINTTVADQGLLDFQDQWLPIIREIKSLNPLAQLIVTTTYNPYNVSDTTLHNTVDSYLSRTNGSGLNDLILNNASSLGYSVANVYNSFNDNYSNNMGAVTYFYPSPWDIIGMLTRNPHPNSTGQGIITELCKGVYQPIN